MTLPRLTDIEQRANMVYSPHDSIGVDSTKADAEFIAASHQDVPALTAAIRAALELHQPIEALNTRYNRMQRVCTGCGTDDGNWQTWPCPTVRAITEHLDVKL